MTLPGRRSYGAAVSHRAHRRAEHCRRRRGGWALLTFGLLLCLFVATYSLWYSEGSARTIAIASVDRPTSAKPPQPPSPARTQAVAELRTELQGISRSHAGTYGMIVFDPILARRFRSTLTGASWPRALASCTPCFFHPSTLHLLPAASYQRCHLGRCQVSSVRRTTDFTSLDRCQGASLGVN
jgi:hypothetical protein